MNEETVKREEDIYICVDRGAMPIEHFKRGQLRSITILCGIRSGYNRILGWFLAKCNS